MSKHEKTEWTIIVGSHTIDETLSKKNKKKPKTRTVFTQVRERPVKQKVKKNKGTQTDDNSNDSFWTNVAVHISLTCLTLLIYESVRKRY